MFSHGVFAAASSSGSREALRSRQETLPTAQLYCYKQIELPYATLDILNPREPRTLPPLAGINPEELKILSPFTGIQKESRYRGHYFQNHNYSILDDDVWLELPMNSESLCCLEKDDAKYYYIVQLFQNPDVTASFVKSSFFKDDVIKLWDTFPSRRQTIEESLEQKLSRINFCLSLIEKGFKFSYDIRFIDRSNKMNLHQLYSFNKRALRHYIVHNPEGIEDYIDRINFFLNYDISFL